MAEHKDEGARSDGFLSRWAQRKQAVKAGLPVAEPAPKPVATEKAPNNQVNPALAQQNIAGEATNLIANDFTEPAASAAPAPEVPALTLDDVRALTTESDFKPFMAKNVTPEVKNAAMKKLFTDPHYNVMDMMDTYVDDYSKPDPIPESMLREMVAVKFLKLFERDDEEQAKLGQEPTSPERQSAAIPRDDADSPAAQSVAQSSSAAPAAPAQDSPDLLTDPASQPALPAASPPAHDHPDLRLQPNHATERPGAQRSAG